MNMNDIARLRGMQQEWNNRYFFLGRLYGQDDPTALAIHQCVHELGMFLVDCENKMARREK